MDVVSAAPRAGRLSIFVMHDQLTDRHGHMYTECRGWIRLCRERGVDLKLFVDRDADPAVVSELRAVRLFGTIPFDKLPQGDVPTALKRGPEFAAHSRKFRRCCREAWQAAERKPQVVFFPFAHPRLMDGAAQWLAELPSADRPRVAFNFARPEPEWKVDPNRMAVTGDFGWFQTACERLRALALGDRILFTAVDPRLCVAMSQIGGIECRPTPQHHPYPPDEELAALRPANPAPGLKIALLGAQRPEKGGDALVENITAITAKRRDARFHVQVTDASQAEVLATSLRAAPLPLQVAISAGVLTPDDFYRSILAADIVLLPYVDPSYVLRPSAIFADAVVCGTPVVARARTWAADRLGEGWGAGETFEAATPDEIASAVGRAAARLPALKAQAAGCGAGWRKIHSLEAHLDHALSWLGLAEFARAPVPGAG